MNPASIKEKLKNVAKREGKPFDYLLTLYLIERFLLRRTGMLEAVSGYRSDDLEKIKNPQ